MQGKGTQSGPAQALEQNRAAISKLAQRGTPVLCFIYAKSKDFPQRMQ